MPVAQKWMAFFLCVHAHSVGVAINIALLTECESRVFEKLDFENLDSHCFMAGLMIQLCKTDAKSL